MRRPGAQDDKPVSCLSGLNCFTLHSLSGCNCYSTSLPFRPVLFKWLASLYFILRPKSYPHKTPKSCDCWRSGAPSLPHTSSGAPLFLVTSPVALSVPGCPSPKACLNLSHCSPLACFQRQTQRTLPFMNFTCNHDENKWKWREKIRKNTLWKEYYKGPRFSQASEPWPPVPSLFARSPWNPHWTSGLLFSPKGHV